MSVMSEFIAVIVLKFEESDFAFCLTLCPKGICYITDSADPDGAVLHCLLRLTYPNK